MESIFKNVGADGLIIDSIRFKNNNIELKIYSVEEGGKRRIQRVKKVGDFVVISGVHAKLHLKSGIYENVLYNDLKVNK